jgi:hypothetical protein
MIHRWRPVRHGRRPHATARQPRGTVRRTWSTVQMWRRFGQARHTWSETDGAVWIGMLGAGAYAAAWVAISAAYRLRAAMSSS